LGLLSASTSITRYQVVGTLDNPVIETVGLGLKKHIIRQIDEDSEEKSVGWTTPADPYSPDFEGSSFVVGPFFVFSLRIDKKKVPSKVFKKYFVLESKKRLSESGRQYLTRSEKSEIKEEIIDRLLKKMPSSPTVYDLVWDHERSSLLFFSGLKFANEELETLFHKSFNLNLIRFFPYTAADLSAGLSVEQKNRLQQLSPTTFVD
jgi:DNA recombination-dependent growth factor C